MISGLVLPPVRVVVVPVRAVAVVYQPRELAQPIVLWRREVRP